MAEHNFFTCKIGNFDDPAIEADILNQCIKNNVYLLHRLARYPSPMNWIKKGDVVLLIFYNNIVAHGIATGGVIFEHENYNDGWNRIIKVDKWFQYDSQNFGRGVDSWGIRNARLGGGSMSPVKHVKPEYARIKMSEFLPNADNEDIQEVSSTTISLEDILFSKHLTIPNYQRTYCWHKSQIIEFLETIKSYVTNYKTADTTLHLGTIVLKLNEQQQYDIIDGQQRLITLALFMYALDNSKVSKLLEEKIASHDAKKHIHWAKNTITAWLQQNPIHSHVKIIEQIQFCAVILPKNANEQLAYTFFNSLNSSGKKLTDYELLKSHHLRYVEGEKLIKKLAQNWDTLSETDQRLIQLLEYSLYRLRSWVKRQGTGYATSRNRLVYRHFSARRSIVEDLFFLAKELRFNSTIKGGEIFFHYTEYYNNLFSEFEKTQAYELAKIIGGHSGNVLKDIITPILFLFYCKFGEFYLNDALFVIAYRISALRNEGRVQRTDINKGICHDIVQELDSAALPAQFFDWALEPAYMYTPVKRGGTVNAYWHSLICLYKNLSEHGHTFIDKKNIEAQADLIWRQLS